MTTCPECGSTDIARWRPYGYRGVIWHKCRVCGHLERRDPVSGEAGMRRFETLAQVHLEAMGR